MVEATIVTALREVQLPGSAGPATARAPGAHRVCPRAGFLLRYGDLRPRRRRVRAHGRRDGRASLGCPVGRDLALEAMRASAQSHFTAIANRVIRTPRLRAACRSAGFGSSDPSIPAIVPGPYGELPIVSVAVRICGFCPYGVPSKTIPRCSSAASRS